MEQDSKGGIKIVIYGEPVPQGRPKFARIGSHVHTYDPEKSRNYKQLVRFWVTEHLKKIYGFKPLENAVCVDLTFYMPVSWTRKKRIEAINGTIRPVSKKAGDIDNLFKCVTDSCNGLLWADDCIITDIYARKRYTGDIARTEMIVCEVKPC